MQPFIGQAAVQSTSDPADPRVALAESAKGWHSIQLAVLGFMGFTGATRMGEEPSAPQWMEWTSMTLMGVALVVAIISIALVGRVAFPFYGADMATMAASGLDRPRAQLRNGIRLTYVAGVMVAIACLSAWWPAGGQESVELRDAAGNVVCGTVVDGAPEGTIWLDTADGRFKVDAGQIAGMRAVDAC